MNLSTLSLQLGKYSDMKSDLPPVEQWNPELSGDIDIIIKKDCTWLHEGDEIKRDKLIRIFSTILKKEGNEFFLVTPVEKWRITVEDVPFEIVLAEVQGQEGQQVIRCISNAGDEFDLCNKHPMTLNQAGLPEIEVRNGLMAKLNRNVYYQLAEISTEQSNGEFNIESHGEKFSLAAAQ